jgi:TonB family protein
MSLVYFVLLSTAIGQSAAASYATQGELRPDPVPLGNPGDWVLTDDYPEAALAEERTGLVAFRLTVDGAGSVSACEVTESSGHDDLDTTTCALLTERAKFQPALDSNGKPVSGKYSNRVRWQIPDYPDGPQVVSIRSFPQPPLIADFGNFYLYEKDYPPEAVQRKLEGVTNFDLFITAEGKVGRCVVTTSSGHDVLDRQACATASTWKFTPALGVDGNPTNGKVSHLINWTLPNAEREAAYNARMLPNPFGKEGALTVSVQFDAEGAITYCNVETEGEIPFFGNDSALIKSICDAGMLRKVKPFENASGRAEAKRVIFKLSIEHLDPLPDQAAIPGAASRATSKPASKDGE